jgi:hypothetical protein
MRRLGAHLLTFALLIGLIFQSAAPAAGLVMISDGAKSCSSMCADMPGNCGLQCTLCPGAALGCRANASCGMPLAVAPASAVAEEPAFAPTYVRPATMLLAGRSIEPEQHPPTC